MVEWSVIDLARITDSLLEMLRNAITTSPLWTIQVHGQTIQKYDINVSGAMPGVSRTNGDCQLSLYLLHVSRDPFWRNTPPAGALARTNPAQPLSLNLSYLLTAYADANFWHEQQAMSIALNCFHQTPIYKTATEEFTITVEADTIEEMSRLWQAIAAPIRLSTMFRVAVVFLAPSAPPPASSIPPTQATISVGTDLTNVPTAPGATPVPQLVEVAMQVTYSNPFAGTDPDEIASTVAPPFAVGGATVCVGGLGLDGTSAVAAYVSTAPGGAEWPITAWRVPPVAPDPVSPDELVLAFPTTYAALPASGTPPTATPPPGVYRLTVGDGTPNGVRSNAVPLEIAARIDGLLNPPQLQPNASNVYTITGGGFTPGQTQVVLDSFALTATAAAGAGSFAVTPDGTTITFKLPSPSLAAGRYYVRVLVNGIETSPIWWVQV